MSRQRWLAAASLLSTLAPALAQQAGSIVEAGDTKVSAMMMFLGNEEKVYILDKAEGNAQQINGHPAWGAYYDLATQETTLMDVLTNVFCASGMHLPNGSFVTFGGNGAIGPGGDIGSQLNPDGFSALWDQQYQDFDGRKAIRVLSPCDGEIDGRAECQWFDNATFLAMQKNRWYSAAEPLGDGSIAIIGGFVNGGYVNRNFPNVDPAFEGGAAEPTYEFFPPKGDAEMMQFMIDTSGLNSYAHTYLMPSGQMFVQANLSTMLWEPLTNAEHRLPDMPNGVARVYPASGATAMMPLTPENNWTPTVLFCGGTDMPADAYGNYSYPAIDTWNYVASPDCHSITPEPQDGSAPDYVQEDDMLEPRTMGQFILLPDGTMLVVNGGMNGTAGYAQRTFTTETFDQMPFGESLASGPAFTPAIYDPSKPKGQRWSNEGLSASKIPRLYHSSAILLPDASVLIAGSNPNVDVNLTTVFPTTYTAERFYPPYFSAKVRPVPSGVPKTLSYGGAYFDVTVPSSSYGGSANDAADGTGVWLMRPGFTTHAMNMGQRAMRLNSTTSVNPDGSLTVHTSPPPPNPNILQPGPAFVFVTIKGIPSNGTLVIVGNGQVGDQPTSAAQPLPTPVRLDNVKGGADANNGNGDSPAQVTTSGSSRTGVLVGGIIAGVVAIGILGAVIGIVVQRRRRAAAGSGSPSGAGSKFGAGGAGGGGGVPIMSAVRGVPANDSGAHMPFMHATGNDSSAYMGGGGSSGSGRLGMGTPGMNASSLSLTGTAHEHYGGNGNVGGNGMGMGMGMYSGVKTNPSGEFDSYYETAGNGNGKRY